MDEHERMGGASIELKFNFPFIYLSGRSVPDLRCRPCLQHHWPQQTDALRVRGQCPGGCKAPGRGPPGATHHRMDCAGQADAPAAKRAGLGCGGKLSRISSSFGDVSVDLRQAFLNIIFVYTNRSILVFTHTSCM